MNAPDNKLLTLALAQGLLAVVMLWTLPLRQVVLAMPPQAQSPLALPQAHRPTPINDQQRLFQAVVDNDIKTVRRLLQSPNVDLNAPYNEQAPASLIDIASRYALPDIVQALIENGAKVRAEPDNPAKVTLHPVGEVVTQLSLLARFSNGRPPLVGSPTQTPERFEETLRILLEAGANPDDMLSSSEHSSALAHLASLPEFDGDRRFAQLLLDHGATLDATVASDSPVEIAAAHGRDDLLTPMLGTPRVSPDTLTRALQQAAAHRYYRISEQLLVAGANPNATGDSGTPLLCEALQTVDRSQPLALSLLAHNADTHAACRLGPPLVLAINDPEVVKALLEHGADPNQARADGATALSVLTRHDTELVDVLLAHGARVGFTTLEVESSSLRHVRLDPVVWAILRHHDYLATRLIQRDGMNGVDTRTAIVDAASEGSALTLAELLERGADPNSTSEHGLSALMAAAANGQISTLQQLLLQPDIHVNATSDTQLNLRAAFAFYTEKHESLLTGKRTALMYAAAADNIAEINILLAHGARRDLEDAAGLTALAYAHAPAVRASLGDPGLNTSH